MINEQLENYIYLKASSLMSVADYNEEFENVIATDEEAQELLNKSLSNLYLFSNEGKDPIMDLFEETFNKKWFLNTSNIEIKLIQSILSKRIVEEQEQPNEEKFIPLEPGNQQSNIEWDLRGAPVDSTLISGYAGGLKMAASGILFTTRELIQVNLTKNSDFLFIARTRNGVLTLHIKDKNTEEFIIEDKDVTFIFEVDGKDYLVPISFRKGCARFDINDNDEVELKNVRDIKLTIKDNK